MLKKISAQVTRINSSDSHDSALSNVSGGSGALSSKYNKLSEKIPRFEKSTVYRARTYIE